MSKPKHEEPYYRRKGKKIIIESKVNGKTKYHKTLPDAKDLLIMLRLDIKPFKASLAPTQIGPARRKKFAQEILSEPNEDDIIKTLGEIE